MPRKGHEEIRQTYVGYAECKASPYIDNNLANNPSNAIDVHVVRSRVATGELTSAEGLKIFLECGSEEDNQTSSIKRLSTGLGACLGKIASGGCEYYKKS